MEQRRRGRPHKVDTTPKGIIRLRDAESKLRSHPENHLSAEEFNNILAVLYKCSEGEKEHVIKCETCGFKKQCHRLEDYVGGRADIKKARKGWRNEQTD